jgi:hypothetical protein
MSFFNFKKKAKALKESESSPASDFELPQEFINTLPLDLESYSKVLPLTEDMLPPLMYTYVRDEAIALDNTAPDFIAVPLVILIAVIAGATVAVQPKSENIKYIERPILWGAVIADPSEKKSPATSTAHNLYNPIQAGLDKDYETELACYLDKKEEGEKGAKPGRRKLIVNDLTREALVDHLKFNQNGVLVTRDELTGLLTDLSQEKNATARSFYLTGYNASDTPHYEARRTQPEVYLKRIAISLFGGIQPSMICRFLEDREAGKLDDGLFERLQLMVYPETQGEYLNIATNEEAKKTMFEVINRIHQLVDKSPEQITFRFDDHAQTLYDECCVLTYNRMKEAEENNDKHHKTALGKQNGLLAKLALVFQLILDSETNIITVEALDFAIKWVEYLDSHQQKIYALIKSKTHKSSNSLLNKLPNLPEKFTVTEFSTNDWQYLKTKKQKQDALNHLTEKGYLYPQYVKSGSKGGRPKVIYHKHPSLVN